MHWDIGKGRKDEVGLLLGPNLKGLRLQSHVMP